VILSRISKEARLMRQLQKLVVWIVAIGLVAWAAMDVAYAQRSDVSRGGGAAGGGFQYVVKFACGNFPFNDEEVAPGLYYTDVNVHNPNDSIIKFRKKIALDGFLPQHHGAQTSPIDVILGPDEALEINCSDIIHVLERA